MNTFRTPLAPHPPPQVLRTLKGVFFYKSVYQRLATIEENKRAYYHFWGNLHFSGELITFGVKVIIFEG